MIILVPWGKPNHIRGIPQNAITERIVSISVKLHIITCYCFNIMYTFCFQNVRTIVGGKFVH